MREICQSGSEGGAKRTFVPTPIREKWTRPGGTVDLLASPRDIFRRTLRRALLETPDTALEKFESEERRMAHLQVLDQPSLRDWTRLFSFIQALRARLPSF